MFKTLPIRWPVGITHIWGKFYVSQGYYGYTILYFTLLYYTILYLSAYSTVLPGKYVYCCFVYLPTKKKNAILYGPSRPFPIQSSCYWSYAMGASHMPCAQQPNLFNFKKSLSIALADCPGVTSPANSPNIYFLKKRVECQSARILLSAGFRLHP